VLQTSWLSCWELGPTPMGDRRSCLIRISSISRGPCASRFRTTPALVAAGVVLVQEIRSPLSGKVRRPGPP